MGGVVGSYTDSLSSFCEAMLLIYLNFPKTYSEFNETKMFLAVDSSTKGATLWIAIAQQHSAEVSCIPLLLSVAIAMG